MRMRVDDLLTRSALVFPDKEAVVQAGVSLSYRALESAATRFGHALAARGARPGHRIALALPNSAAFVIAFFAISRIGAVLVPMSPAYTDREFEIALGDAEVSMVLCGAALRDRMESLADHLGQSMIVLPLDDLAAVESLITGVPDDLQHGTPGDWNSPHAILFTSGTTGRAKGAVLSHRSRIVNSLSGRLGYETGSETRANIPAPMYHSGGMILGVVNVIAAGGTLLLPADGSVEAQCHALEELGANLLLTVPTMVYRMVDSPRFKATAAARRFALIHGASPIPRPVVERLLEDYPFCRPFHGYGSTEACQVSVLAPDEYRAYPTATGRALPGVDLQVVRPDGTAVAPGEVGEIVTSGPHVFEGYLNAPEQTREALHDGLHWTGDLATIDERGLFTIAGRRKEMIISGGFNVYAREVEDVLHAHPAVQEAAVFGVSDAEWGEVVAAAIILRPECHADADDLTPHCRAALVGYKVPRRLWFVEQMPRTPLGKVRKFELARRLGAT